jgi:hypothetical protein
MASVGDATGRYGTEEQLRQEVTELTDLLHNDAAFADLRDLLTAHGLPASQTLLAGFIGSEDESMYGVFVTSDVECVRFETGPDGHLIRWETIDDLGALTKAFAAVAVGIAMKRSGQIC